MGDPSDPEAASAEFTIMGDPIKSTPDASTEWFRLTYTIRATLPNPQDESGSCLVTIQNKDNLEVPLRADYYS